MPANGRWDLIRRLKVNKMFLHCFIQRHVSALAMSHLQVDHLFFARQTIHLAMLRYCYWRDLM